MKMTTGLNNKKPIILVFGGSQGAKRINDTLVEIIKTKLNKDYQVIWATGPKQYDIIKEELEMSNININNIENMKILPYIYNMEELMNVVDLMTITDKESFVGALGLWYEKWEGFLKERTINPVTNKSTYTHKKLRSAYNSLKNNLPWLFTWYDHFELGIPNTTNAIDGHFSDLKNKLRNHNGLSLERKKKFINEFLKA